MQMQRRHFQFIADTLKPQADWLSVEDYGEVCYHFAVALQRTNQQFDMTKFMQACGLDWTELEDAAS